MKAAERFDLDFVQFLLQNGADPNKKTWTGNTFVRSGDNLVVALSTISTYGGNTALHFAVNSVDAYLRSLSTKNDPAPTVNKMIDLFIEAGADVNVVNNEGISPLQNAIEHGHEKLPKLLRKHGAVYHPELNYALLFAVTIEHDCKKVQSLLAKGANVNARDPVNNWTLLHWAAAFGDLHMIDLLAANGAVVTARDCRGDTPLHTAMGIKVFADMVGDFVMDKLIKSGANLNAENNDGETPLNYVTPEYTTYNKIVLIAEKHLGKAFSGIENTPEEPRFMMLEGLTYMLLRNAEEKKVVIDDVTFVIDKTPLTSEQLESIENHITKANKNFIKPWAYLLQEMPEIEPIIAKIWEKSREILHAESMRRYKTIQELKPRWPWN
jgi:ankyrin repeat protein